MNMPSPAGKHSHKLQITLLFFPPSLQNKLVVMLYPICLELHLAGGQFLLTASLKKKKKKAHVHCKAHVLHVMQQHASVSHSNQTSLTVCFEFINYT